MKKNQIIKAIVSLIVACSVLFSVTFTLSDEANHINEEKMYFEDVTKDKWYYDMVYSLADSGILPRTEKFKGDVSISKYDLLKYLYSLGEYLEVKGKESSFVPFSDVDPGTDVHDIVSWAYANDMILKNADKTFSPYGECSKEMACYIMVQFMKYANIKAPVRGSTEAFADSLSVTGYARSSVAALKLACIIGGNEDGYFKPWAPLKRGEFISMLYYLYNISRKQAAPGQPWVYTSKDAYTYLYKTYEQKANKSSLADSSKRPVDASYFDDAVFVGDSVTASLQYYCAAKGALGNAKFLCATSLSPINAHKSVSANSTHPVYLGEKMLIEDGVAKIGAKKVYIMLGINSLYTFNETVNGMRNLINKIVQKSPGVKIIIQSVTPMTKNSPIKKATLNNDVIKRYNAELIKMASENGWHYINVYDAVADSNGDLRGDYCSDPKTMGIHFNYTADEAWVNYLKNYTP